MAVNKAQILLDTGPLSTLCGFPLHGPLYLHSILRYAEITLTDGVVSEAGQGKIWRTVSPLLKTGELQSIKAPASPSILDVSYGKDLGLGERSTIRAALQTGFVTVIDDKNAFIAASRFGLRPIGFQDLLVMLVKDYLLPPDLAIEIVTVTAGQYPKMFLAHTLDMLREK
jgi:predicted nucleic acid-binding protein